MMLIQADEVSEIASVVWSTLLERSLVPSTPPVKGLGAAAQVRIGGAWDGRVRIEMTPELARQLAAQLFMLPENQLDDELIDDALGELANIIGGNLKALLPDGSALGLPGPRTAEPAETVSEVILSCDEHQVVVAIDRH